MTNHDQPCPPPSPTPSPPPSPTQGRVFVFDAEDEEGKYAWMEAIGMARVEAVHKLNAKVR